MKHLKFVLLIIIVTAIAIAFGISIYKYPQACTEFFSVFVRDPLWTSVFVTIVLVAINIFYLWQNRQVIDEMKKAREVEFMPHVRAELFFLGPIYVMLRITNFGKGPAINIKAQITFLPSGTKRLWEQTIMSPKEFIRILLPDGNIYRILEQSAKIIVDGEYHDIFNKTYPIHDEMDAKEFIDRATELQPILEKDLTTIVDEMKNEIKDIKDALKGIERTAKKS
jgi:hypothetical protein